MTYPLGQDFTCWFYPLVDGETPQNLLTSQTPAIHLFTEMPSLAAAAAGTGAFSTVTSWTWSAGDAGWYFTVPAIDDPDPASLVRIRAYWLAINFKLQAGGDTQTVLRSLYAERVTGVDRTVNVTDDDLKGVFPQLDSCSTEAQRRSAVTLAVDRVKAKLTNDGYAWAQVHNLQRLKFAVVYRVLYGIMLVQIQQGNDKYAAKYKEFKDDYTETMDALLLEYDSDGDGKPDVQVKSSPPFLMVER